MEKEKVKFLLRVIKLDKTNNSFISFTVLLFHRLAHLLYVSNHIFLLKIFLLIENIYFYIFNINAQIHYGAVIGMNIRLPHKASGVIISKYAIIHNNVTIFHQVTIGINESKSLTNQKIVIGEGCYLSCGCKIISAVLGNYCKVAPNAVVYKDVPPHTLVYSLNQYRKLESK